MSMLLVIYKRYWSIFCIKDLWVNMGVYDPDKLVAVCLLLKSETWHTSYSKDPKNLERNYRFDALLPPLGCITTATLLTEFRTAIQSVHFYTTNHVKSPWKSNMLYILFLWFTKINLTNQNLTFLHVTGGCKLWRFNVLAVVTHQICMTKFNRIFSKMLEFKIVYKNMFVMLRFDCDAYRSVYSFHSSLPLVATLD